MSRSATLRAIATKLADPEQPIFGRAPIRAAYGSNDVDSGLPGNDYYRPLGGRGTRDIPPGLRSKFIERENEYADTYPLAVRTLSLMAEFVKPGRLKPKAKDARIDAYVQKFWTDPRNTWAWSMKALAQCAWTTGDLFVPMRVNEFDGSVTRDYWDPADVADVRLLSGSSRIATHVLFQPAGVNEGKWYPVIRPVLDPTSRNFGRLMGADPRAIRIAPAQANPGKWLVLGRGAIELYLENTREEAQARLPADNVHGVVAFRFNARENSKFGRGVFMASMDYWATLGDLHAAWAERAQMMARVWGDIKVTGGPTEIEAAATRIARNSPRYGSLFMHNEGEELNMNAPSTNAADSVEQEKMLRQFGSAPGGIPQHVLASDFTSGTRAVAADASDPMYLRGIDLQDDLAIFVEYVCRYAVDSAFIIQPERFAGVEDYGIDIERPSLLRKDLAVAAVALVALGTALDDAVAGKRIDRQTSREIWVRALADAGADGVEIEEVEARLLRDVGAVDPQTAAKMKQIADRMRQPAADVGASPVAPEDVVQPVVAPAGAPVAPPPTSPLPPLPIPPSTVPR